jgi:hypothetical protein
MEERDVRAGGDGPRYDDEDGGVMSRE